MVVVSTESSTLQTYVVSLRSQIEDFRKVCGFPSFPTNAVELVGLVLIGESRVLVELTASTSLQAL